MRRSPLRTRPPADRRDEPGWRLWHAPVWGECAVCGKRDRLVRHHVVTEQKVRREGGGPWDLRNSIGIGIGYVCVCHRDHHNHPIRRIALSKVSVEAIEFAVELLGEPQATDYLRRTYAPAQPMLANCSQAHPWPLTGAEHHVGWLRDV